MHVCVLLNVIVKDMFSPYMGKIHILLAVCVCIVGGLGMECYVNTLQK